MHLLQSTPVRLITGCPHHVVQINICRPCHNAVHETWDELELAENYNSLEALLATEQIQQFIKFTRTQKTVSRGDANNPKLRYRR